MFYTLFNNPLAVFLMISCVLIAIAVALIAAHERPKDIAGVRMLRAKLRFGCLAFAMAALFINPAFSIGFQAIMLVLLFILSRAADWLCFQTSKHVMHPYSDLFKLRRSLSHVPSRTDANALIAYHNGNMIGYWPTIAGFVLVCGQITDNLGAL